MGAFLVDENLPRSLVRDLVVAGHQAVHVRDVGLHGRPDEDVVAYAAGKGLALTTCDKGIANSRRFPPGSHKGIIVGRVSDELTIDAKKAIFLHAVEALSSEELDGNLIIVSVSAIRIRRR